MYKGGLKSSYDDIISVAADFFYEWDPSIATPTEEAYRLQGELWWKINFIGHILWQYLGQPVNFSSNLYCSKTDQFDP